MNKRLLITLLTLIVIAVTAGVAIFLAKGYTFSTKEARVVGTGIISVTSVPDGASVYIDGHLTTATNTTIPTLPPKSYSVKIIKDGFIPWEKKIDVREGLVTEIKATLFPALPTFYPLTYNGVVLPVLSPDGQKLAFAVPFSTDGSLTKQRGGVWVWTMSSQPISFARGAEPHQLISSSSNLDFSKGKLRWSPDSKQLLVTLPDSNSPRNYLVSADQQTSLSDLRDITPVIDSTLKSWADDQKAKDSVRIVALRKPDIRQTASDSASLAWSPDETKFIFGGGKKEVTPTPAVSVTPTPLKGYKVFSLEDNKQYDLPEALSYHWLPDSNHVILVQKDKISIAEFDGQNIDVIYAGAFEDDEVFPWPDSSRLVIVTSFNTPTASTPNLFGINLK